MGGSALFILSVLTVRSGYLDDPRTAGTIRSAGRAVHAVGTLLGLQFNAWPHKGKAKDDCCCHDLAPFLFLGASCFLEHLRAALRLEPPC